MQSTAQILAEDVLFIIFDAFPLREVLAFSLVCRHWRTTVRAHPTFWRSVALVKPTPDAVDFFLDRLALNPTALVSITITPPLLPAQLVNDVVDTIQKNMGRVKMLSLDFTSFPAPALQRVMRALSHPAPALETVHLRANTTRSSSMAFRRTLFAHAPKLRHVILSGIELDVDKKLPRAFEKTTHLTYTSPVVYSVYVLVQRALTQFPNLKVLHLIGKTLFLRSNAVPALGALRSLKLEYTFKPRLYPNGSLRAFQKLHTITLFRLSPSPRFNDAFFAHLNGALHLHIALSDWDVAKGHVRIALEEITGDRPHRARIVEQLSFAALASVPAQPAGGLSGRLNSACVPISLLASMGDWLGGTAARMRELRVHVDCGMDGPLHAVLVCPQLERLTLIGGPAGRELISARDISFLLSCVLKVSDVAVMLESIAEGGPDRFAGTWSAGDSFVGPDDCGSASADFDNEGDFFSRVKTSVRSWASWFSFGPALPQLYSRRRALF